MDNSINNPPVGSDEDDDEEGDAYRLDEVSSDVEMHPDDLDELDEDEDTDGR